MMFSCHMKRKITLMQESLEGSLQRPLQLHIYTGCDFVCN